ncbi:MAG: PorT family protein [Sphingobacteriaceae bacterium]|nr:MAG: PorT family protein [Sphingobacteriaceae bacterium]
MKRILLTAIICTVAGFSFAQQTTTISTVTTTTTVTKDTTIAKKDSKKYKFSFGDGQRRRDSIKREAEEKDKVNFDIIFRFDLGYTTLIDNGSFTLSPQNDFLSYRQGKTSNVGFELAQFGYRFGNNFKMSLGAGFDWTLIRLNQNITIQRNTPTLTYVVDNIQYSKNRFSSTYLRVPLGFEFRTNESRKGKRLTWIVGPEAGLLLGGRVKQISAENGKQKMDDNYHFTKLRYGAFTRLSYESVGVYAKYYMNDMFENSPAQAGLKNFAIGLTIEL